VGNLKRIKCGFGLMLIQFVFLYGCSSGKFNGGSLIPLLDSDSFELINTDLILPDEFIFDGITPVEFSKFSDLKGSWGKEYMQWNFIPQRFPRIDDGAIEITMNYLPPQRFKLSFLFRNSGSSFFLVEIFSNQIRINKQSNGKSIEILKLPLRFVTEKNVLRLFFCEELLALSFNDKEIFRLRDTRSTGSGYFNSISINSVGNLGIRTHIKYLSFNNDKDKEQYRNVFNVLYSSDADGSIQEYLRQVRIGDLTMPAVLAPSPSRIVIPITVPKFADLRFSTATLPVSNAGNAVIRYKVDFLEKGKEKPVNLFNDEELPVNIFDQKWTSCRVDLKDYEGKKGDLIFSVSIEGKGQTAKNGVIALWGAPRILITPKRAETRNVILITIENFGQESLQLKESTKSLTPAIHNWVADSVVFANGYPSSKWVSASLFSILHGDSGISDEYIRWMENSLKPADNFGYSLAKVFTENGYDTAAFMQGVNCQPFLGLSEGYNEYYNENKFRESEADISNSDKLAARASLWIEQRINKSCFLHIHFNTLSDLDTETLVKNIKDNRNLQWEFWRRYGEALSRLDANVGKLLRSLWKVGALKSAVIIITGTDGINVPSAQGIPYEIAIGNDQFLRVPIIFNIQSKFPPTGERKSRIFLSDLYSTILEYMGMKYSATGDSRSFLKSIESDEELPEEGRMTVTQLSEPMNPAAGYVLSEGGYKALLVREKKDKPFSLFFFDLKSDPYERSPLSKEMIKNSKLSSELNSRVKSLLNAKPLMTGMKTIGHYLKTINQSSALGQ
jgi:arylsulfatase A-like enzyme